MSRNSTSTHIMFVYFQALHQKDFKQTVKSWEAGFVQDFIGLDTQYCKNAMLEFKDCPW